MKQQLEVSLLPSGWDASPLQGYPPPQHFTRFLDNSPVLICNGGGMGGMGGGWGGWGGWGGMGGGGREAP